MGNFKVPEKVAVIKVNNVVPKDEADFILLIDKFILSDYNFINFRLENKLFDIFIQNEKFYIHSANAPTEIMENSTDVINYIKKVI